MEKKQLYGLLNPERIAVIGASNSAEKVGGIVFRRLLASNRSLFPVNPKETVIEGHKVYPSIGDLPAGIDLAIVTIGAAAAVKAVEQGIKKEIPFFILVAGGFGEIGAAGRDLEKRLKELVSENDIRILGPNSLGIFLPDENIDTIFVEHGDTALGKNGRVACIVQSGSVGVEALGYAANTGFGMRAFVGLGNKSDLDEIDFLRYFSLDSKTNCLGFYLENIEKGRQFLAEARKIAIKRPIVVLKAGRTHTAASAVVSHTGKLAGSDRVVQGALNQCGIQRVDDDEAFCDATKVLSMLKPSPGNRVAVLTAAGGYGVMCTDYIERKGTRADLKMAKLQDETKRTIKKATFDFTACENPVDITASATDEMFSQSLDALIKDRNVDIVICIAFFAPPGITKDLIRIIADKTHHTGKPIIVFTKYGPFTDGCIKDLFDGGVVGYPSVSRAVRAARFLVERSRILTRFDKGHIKEERLDTSAKEWVSKRESYQNPDEFEAKQLASLYGIPSPDSLKILPGDNINIECIQSPYVIKVCSSKIVHKTDSKGVVLNNTPLNIYQNIEKMRQRFPKTPILVESQLTYEGPEFIIGAVKDPELGLALMVGAGGIMTEIYNDTAFRLAPCTTDQALDMIDELQISPVFNNFRGMNLDKEGLAAMIASVSRMACDLDDRLGQLDINPIVFSQNRWVALDIKILFE